MIILAMIFNNRHSAAAQPGSNSMMPTFCEYFVVFFSSLLLMYIFVQ